MDRFHRAPAEPGPLFVRSRQARVPGIARTERDRFGPGTLGWRRVQASPGIDRRGNPPRAAIASQLTAPSGRLMVFCARHRVHAFVSLCWNRARKRARTPGAFDRIGTSPPDRWGNADRAKCRPPRSKPVTHASRLVTHMRRRWHSDLGESRPRGQLTYDCTPIRSVCVPGLKNNAELLRGDRGTPLSADGADAHRPVRTA